MKPILITETEQPYQLVRHLKEAGIKHEDLVRVDIPNMEVKTVPMLGVKGIFFCKVQEISVLKKLGRGDGGELPESVIIHGLHIGSLREGTYDLSNVLVHPNGANNIYLDDESKILPGGEEGKGLITWFREKFQLSG